jgi:hypothetical protein
MRVREWTDIVEDVVEQDVDPNDWRAIAGDRAGGVGEDMYLGHPKGGLYHLKTYAKNPFEVQGVGTQVARRLDDEIGTYLPQDADRGRFAVQTPPEDKDEAERMATEMEEVIKAHADAPTEHGDLFRDVMDAMNSPAFGPIEYDQYDRPEPLEALSTTFEDAEAVLDTELDELVRDDDVGRAFR